MIRIVSAAVALACLTTPAAAEVVERSADHFVLRYESITEGPMEDLPGVVGDLPRWWDPAHTYSGKADNLSISPAVGACFCERLDDGSVFEHGRVQAWDAGTGVLLHAALGPLNGKTTQADWSIGWTGGQPGVRVVMTYVVRGDGLEAYADAVDGVMQTQFDRMIRYLEYGEPA